MAWVYFVGGAPPNNTHISSILTIATFMLAPVHRLGCRAGRLAAKCTQESSRPSWLRLVYRVLGVAESHDGLHKVARVGQIEGFGWHIQNVHCPECVHIVQHKYILQVHPMIQHWLASVGHDRFSQPSWLRLVYRVLGVAESHDRLHKVARVVRRRKLCPLWQLLVGGAGAEAGAGAGAGAGAHREHRAAVCGVSSSSRPSPGVAAARGGAHANDRQIAIVPIQNRDAATCRWGGAERHPRLPHGAGRHF